MPMQSLSRLDDTAAELAAWAFQLLWGADSVRCRISVRLYFDVPLLW